MNSIKTFSNSDLIDFFLQVFLKGNWKCSYLFLVLDLMIVRRSLSSCFRVYFSVIVIVAVFFCFALVLSYSSACSFIVYISENSGKEKFSSFFSSFSFFFFIFSDFLHLWHLFFMKNATQPSFIDGEYAIG